MLASLFFLCPTAIQSPAVAVRGPTLFHSTENNLYALATNLFIDPPTQAQRRKAINMRNAIFGIAIVAISIEQAFAAIGTFVLFPNRDSQGGVSRRAFLLCQSTKLTGRPGTVQRSTRSNGGRGQLPTRLHSRSPVLRLHMGTAIEPDLVRELLQEGHHRLQPESA